MRYEVRDTRYDCCPATLLIDLGNQCARTRSDSYLVPRPDRMFPTGITFPATMRVKRAAKYGFCSGVRIADLKVKRFVAGGGRGAILGQVSRNERVVEEMENLGVRTVEDIAAVPEPTLLFPPQSVPPSVHE